MAVCNVSLCILRLKKSYILLKQNIVCIDCSSADHFLLCYSFKRNEMFFGCAVWTREGFQSDICAKISLDWWHWLSVLWYDKLEFISFLYSDFSNILSVSARRRWVIQTFWCPNFFVIFMTIFIWHVPLFVT